MSRSKEKTKDIPGGRRAVTSEKTLKEPGTGETLKMFFKTFITQVHFTKTASVL